ncbi:hypothetical protein [Sagittula sp. S175]|uniref:hypothetical protein n=1 Tax=Sagittula sp. S175 TaxID=3415129 RepID=UPI003C7A38EF
MASAADPLRPLPASAGVWRHPIRKPRRLEAAREMIQLLAAAIAGALIAGALATAILLPGPVRAEGLGDRRPVARPALLMMPPPVCACILPDADED